VTDRCVVFDLGGVLVMSEHLWAHYLSERTGMDRQAAAAAGLTVLGMEHPQYPVDHDAAGRAAGLYHSLGDITALLVDFLDAR
jgi:beta-phosphoglucomutase-like phosphatase (HAD superfamily)